MNTVCRMNTTRKKHLLAVNIYEYLNIPNTLTVADLRGWGTHGPGRSPIFFGDIYSKSPNVPLEDVGSLWARIVSPPPPPPPPPLPRIPQWILWIRY